MILNFKDRRGNRYNYVDASDDGHEVPAQTHYQQRDSHTPKATDGVSDFAHLGNPGHGESHYVTSLMSAVKTPTLSSAALMPRI